MIFDHPVCVTLTKSATKYIIFFCDMYIFAFCLYFLFAFCLVFYSIYFCFVKRFDQLWKGAIVSIVYVYVMLFSF